eukprot:9057142-Pyramimonas_sp.AAC.1
MEAGVPEHDVAANLGTSSDVSAEVDAIMGGEGAAGSGNAPAEAAVDPSAWGAMAALEAEAE